MNVKLDLSLLDESEREHVELIKAAFNAGKLSAAELHRLREAYPTNTRGAAHALRAFSQALGASIFDELGVEVGRIVLVQASLILAAISIVGEDAAGVDRMPDADDGQDVVKH
jgi:hypothetical protein